MHAINDKDGVSVENPRKCIGCGLCATGCPNGAAKLTKSLTAKLSIPHRILKPGNTSDCTIEDWKSNNSFSRALLLSVVASADGHVENVDDTVAVNVCVGIV